VEDEIEVCSPPSPPKPIAVDSSDSGSLESDDEDNRENNENLAGRIEQLSTHGAEMQDAVDGLRNQLSTMSDRFHSLDSRLDTIVSFPAGETQQIHLSPPGREPLRGADSPEYGTTPPAKILEEFLSWIETDSTLLTNIVHGKLENKDLIKLLPEEDRPKGRNHGTGILLNTSGR
jgi:hypothetical protein